MLTSTSLPLVLGTPGKTGSRIANRLLSRGLHSRPNGDVEETTGAAPTSSADFARRPAAAWALEEAR
jgi:hypothetical protein